MRNKKNAFNAFNLLLNPKAAFPTYFEETRKPEMDLKVDQYSKQYTSRGQCTVGDFLVDLDFYRDAQATINMFGSNMFGGVVEYPRILDTGQCGHQSYRILEFERNRYGLAGVNEPLFKFSRVAEIVMFGSGGTPEFLFPYQETDSYYQQLMLLESEAHNSERKNSVQTSLQHLRALRKYSDNKKLDERAWCRVGRAIQQCWRVSTTLDRDMGGWLLKIAVHAACTLQRVRRGALGRMLAVATLMQLSHELTQLVESLSALTLLLPETPVPENLATICAMLVEAGNGFVTAGVCLLFSFYPSEEDETRFVALAWHCIGDLNTLSHVALATSGWNILYERCLRQTNFCPSKPLKHFSGVLFHLIGRAEHLKTFRKFHSNCDQTCKQLSCTDNDQQAGHLREGCQCIEIYFEPKETAELVLFDNECQKLVVAGPGAHYVAVSQVWFQGIFGQSSRKCGKCTLDYLGAACKKIGARYAWIDTLCMPRNKDLRSKVVKQLRHIYMEASATLVVDAGLISSKALTVLDLSLAISLSDWSSRVWTLQEGLLASRLLFCVGHHRVIALPQKNVPLVWLGPRNLISGGIIGMYGQREEALGLPFESVLTLAKGRQTSHDQDYMYGLSALWPHVPGRPENVELVAIEVAKMYQQIDLAILKVPCKRCQTEGYRWMPTGAKDWSLSDSTGVRGTVTADGLECAVEAQITILSVVTTTTKLHNAKASRSGIKYWYSTTLPGVLVGTRMEAHGLIFCQISNHNDGGFLVSRTKRDNTFIYIQEAQLDRHFQQKPVTIRAEPVSILLT